MQTKLKTVLFLSFILIFIPRENYNLELNTTITHTITKSDLTYYFTYPNQHFGNFNSEQVLNILPNLFYRLLKTSPKKIDSLSLRDKIAKHYLLVIYKFSLEYVILSLKGVILLFPFHDFY